MSGILSTISTIGFYRFIVYPGANYILHNEKTAKHSLMGRKLVTLIFLFCASMCVVGYNIHESFDRESLFGVMEVPRTATDAEIKSAYQRLARELHPDKNAGPDAEEQFVKMKRAYEILSVPSLRATYDRWGQQGLDKLMASSSDDTANQAALSMLISYATWAVMTFVLTIYTSHTDSRTMAFSGLALILLFDIGMKTTPVVTFTVPFFSTNVYQMVTYIDPVSRNWDALQLILQRQQVIFFRMRELEQQLRLKTKGTTQPFGVGDGSGQAENIFANSNLPRNLQARNLAANSKGNQPNKRTGIPTWLIMICVSAFIQIFFSK